MKTPKTDTVFPDRTAETISSKSDPKTSLTTPPHRRKIWLWVFLSVCLFLVLLTIRNHTGSSKPVRPANPPVPIVPTTVQKKDFPIYLDGLGTVQAYNSVTIHSRVDGQLDKIVFAEGNEVKTGDLLAIIDPRPFQAALAQAQAKQREDQAQLVNAQSIFIRNTDLVKKGVLDKQTFDTSKFQTDQLQATVQADQAAVETAQIQLDYTQIKSPIDGRVGLRQVDAGNIIHAADANGLVVITQLRPILVLFTLPQQQLASVLEKSKNANPLVVQLMDKSGNFIVEGTLGVVDNQIDQTTATVKLKATFANQDEQLWPGQFVNVRLLLETRKDAVIIPGSAVQLGPDGTYAYVVKSDKTVEIRPIKTGPTESGDVLIEEGLTPGETVVLDGQYKLQPGSKVEVNTTNRPSVHPKSRRENGGGKTS